jgi:hypothetical protein
MSNPSNLYAEKIYSEHPTVLWALDDQLDYVSLLTETQRRIYSGWTITNGSATSGISVLNEPFQSSATTVLEGIVPVGLTNVITCISPEILNISSLDENLNTFCFGSFFYSNSAYVSSIEIGYEYTDTTTSNIVQKLKKFDTSIFQNWSFISETFEILILN